MRTLRTTATLLVACLIGLAPAAAASPPALAAVPMAGSSNPTAGRSGSEPASVRAAAADYASIFSGADADLAGAGWTACPTPVRWSVDTQGLTDAQAAAQISNLRWAFDRWATASGLTFEYAGTQSLTYDDDAFTLLPADGSGAQNRHVYLAFVGASARMSDATVGLGSPSQVMVGAKEIVGGEAVFRVDHVTTATAKADRSLYLHELGHVLGLAHASVSSDVMYPVVSTRTTLGSGDIKGVKAMTKPCAA